MSSYRRERGFGGRNERGIATKGERHLQYRRRIWTEKVTSLKIKPSDDIGTVDLIRTGRVLSTNHL